MMRLSSILFIGMFAIACGHYTSKEKRTVVFLHGLHLDETSWRAVVQHMDHERYELKALRVPKRNAEIFYTLSDLAQLSCGELDHKSSIVAHSFGGAIVNEMAGICPSRMERIIYLAAIVPKDKELPFELMSKEDHEHYSQTVEFKNDIINPREPSVFFKFMDKDLDVKHGYTPSIFSEPISLGKEKVRYNEQRLEKIPKIYIVTKDDKIISPKTQKKYITRMKFEMVEEIEAGHLPMLSNPRDLAQMISENLEKNFKD